MQYVIGFCSRREATSGVISGRFVGPIVPNNFVNFAYPRLNISREVPHEAVCGGIFHDLARNIRPEKVSDIISGANVGHVDVDAHVKVSDLAQTVLEIYDCLTL